MIEVDVDRLSVMVVDGDNQLAVVVTIVGDLKVVDASSSVGIDGLHEHGVTDSVTVGGWSASDIDVTKAGRIITLWILPVILKRLN